MTVQQPGDGGERVANGLYALSYVPLTDVDTATGQQLLTALERAHIAAYLSPDARDGSQQRLYVAAEERVDARTIVRATVRALDGDELGDRPDPLAGVDTDAAFDAIVADWHVDTTAAVRDAERDLTREDADWRLRLNRRSAADDGGGESESVWLDDDHYVPPPPPPLPRLAAPTIMAMSVLAVSILVLGIGGQFGLASGLTLVLGVCGLLLGVTVLLSRVRDRHRDDDDDGSAI